MSLEIVSLKEVNSFLTFKGTWTRISSCDIYNEPRNRVYKVFDCEFILEETDQPFDEVQLWLENNGFQSL